MKKNFFKKLSVVLALAMAVSAVAPAATTASAAAAPAFKSKSATVKVGQTKNYGMGNVTAYSVKFVIGNKKVATVTKSGKTAKVRGVAEGKTTLRADLKAYKSKKELQVRMPVTVIPDKATLSNVNQTKSNEIVAKFSAALTEVKVTDFSLVRDDNVVFPLKSVSLDSSDKTKVTLTTYSDMIDGRTYTVTYDSKTANFVATDGTVTDVNVTPNVITAGKAKEVKVQTLDAKGVVLSETDFTGTLPSGVTCTIIPDKGYTDGSKLYLPEIGDTAKATVEYHTYKYDSEGQEIGVIKKEITITAVKDDTVISNFNFTIVDSQSSPAWGATSFEANKKAKIDTEQYAYFNIKDSKGDEIAETEYADYKVSSSDSSKLLVTETTLTQKGSVVVKGVGEGVAYIVVKNAATGATVTTLQVTVIGKSKAATLNLDKTSFSVSTDAAISTVVKATVKDQYGNDLDNDKVYGSFTVEVLSNPSGSTINKDSNLSGIVAVTNLADKHTITLTPSAIVKNSNKDFGSYTFKVSAKVGDNTVSRTFSYNIVKVASGATSGYELVLDNTSVDTTVTNSTTGGKTIKVEVGEFKNGVQVTTAATIASIELKKADGTIIASSKTAATSPAISAPNTVTGKSSFEINVSEKSDKSFTKHLEAGNYMLTIVAGGKTLTKSFTVVDTQGTGSANIKKTTDVNEKIAAFLTNKDNVVFNYQGVEQDSVIIKDIDGSYTSTSAYVKTAKVEVTVPGSNENKVTVTYTLNTSFTGSIDGLK